MKQRTKILCGILSAAIVSGMMPANVFAGDISYTAGTYPVTVTIQPDEEEEFAPYELGVNVTISEDGTIGAIEVDSSTVSANNSSYVNKALNGTKKLEGMVSKLVGKTAEEAASVDVVTGATCTSNGILSAVQEAYETAKTELPDPEKVDKTALNDFLLQVDKLVETDYTSDSWSAFSDAKEEAEKVNKQEDAKQEEVDEALKTLKDAKEALVEASQELASTVEMKAISIGGISYYYADTKTAAEDAEYQVVIVNRRAGTSTTYTYAKSDLTKAGDTAYYYIVAPGAAALSGTLYGNRAGTGEATSYKALYSGMGLTADDPAYDVVSSATSFTGVHAKDISSTVVYGQGSEGEKVITGLEIKKQTESVSSDLYILASILKSENESLTEEQEKALAVTLKQNPMEAPATDLIKTAVQDASYTKESKYGTGEFIINPDTSIDGYQWNEYWDNMYAATISNGETTVGAVHWIDLYGEKCTSGFHYNKVELALNNGVSVGANAAEVNRFAAFYDSETNELKEGIYTITLYSDGYEPLTATVEVKDEAEIAPGPVLENGQWVLYDEDCQKVTENGTPVVNGKKYFVENGVLKSGMQKLGKWQLYFDPATHAAVTGITNIDGKTYMFDKNGVKIQGPGTLIVDGNKYWFESDGSMRNGWQTLGQWEMYYDLETYAAATGVTRIDGKTYLFDKNGVKIKGPGTPLVFNNKYWLASDDSLKTGWLKLANWKLYFDPETYAAVTGNKEIEGKLYTFNSDGVLQNQLMQ